MRARVVVVAVLLAGCSNLSQLTGSERLEPASLSSAEGGVTGALVLADGLAVADARLAVAPWDEPARSASFDAPGARGQTAIARDHWLLVLAIREGASPPTSSHHRLSLEWNGEAKGSVALLREARSPARPVEIAFDVGAHLERSNVYLLTAVADGG